MNRVKQPTVHGCLRRRTCCKYNILFPYTYNASFFFLNITAVLSFDIQELLIELDTTEGRYEELNNPNVYVKGLLRPINCQPL